MGVELPKDHFGASEGDLPPLDAEELKQMSMSDISSDLLSKVTNMLESQDPIDTEENLIAPDDAPTEITEQKVVAIEKPPCFDREA